VPTRFVGVQLALAVILALFGLSFIADPCGGGGDLCLGGTLGMFALGIAALGGVGIVLWLVGRRASPLLVWDAALAVVGGWILLSAAPSGQGLLLLGALGATFLGLAGAMLAGREVATHRIERVAAVVALAGAVVVLGIGGGPILVVGLVALFVGSRLAREDVGQVA
jgi:hypothetical protein